MLSCCKASKILIGICGLHFGNCFTGSATFCSNCNVAFSSFASRSCREIVKRNSTGHDIDPGCHMAAMAARTRSQQESLEELVLVSVARYQKQYMVWPHRCVARSWKEALSGCFDRPKRTFRCARKLTLNQYIVGDVLPAVVSC